MPTEVAGPDFVEIRVLLRPLVALGAFARAAGPALAIRRSERRGRAARLVSPPLPTLFRVIDFVATRLAQRPPRIDTMQRHGSLSSR